MARLESRPRNRPRWGTFSKGFPPFPSFLRSSLFFGTKVTSRIYDLAVDQGNTRSFSIRRNDSGKAPVKHGLLLFRTRISPFSFSLLLLSQDISKKKKMSYPSISKLIKNFQFSPHFDDRFETGNDSTRYFSGERNTVHWKGKHSRISECIFVPYSTFIYTYPPLQFKSAHYTLRDFLFEMVIRWNKLRRSHVSHRTTRKINFIPGPEKHRWNLIRRVRNQSSRNGCRFDPESCYLQSSFTPFSWSYTRTSKGIALPDATKNRWTKATITTERSVWRRSTNRPRFTRICPGLGFSRGRRVRSYA